jgi:molecular chaperone GrpE
MVRDERYEEPTVIDELQRGYTLKGRLLRPAMVRVASRE